MFPSLQRLIDAARSPPEPAADRRCSRPTRSISRSTWSAYGCFRPLRAAGGGAARRQRSNFGAVRGLSLGRHPDLGPFGHAYVLENTAIV